MTLLGVLVTLLVLWLVLGLLDVGSGSSGGFLVLVIVAIVLFALLSRGRL